MVKQTEACDENGVSLKRMNKLSQYLIFRLSSRLNVIWLENFQSLEAVGQKRKLLRTLKSKLCPNKPVSFCSRRVNRLLELFRNVFSFIFVLWLFLRKLARDALFQLLFLILYAGLLLEFLR